MMHDAFNLPMLQPEDHDGWETRDVAGAATPFTLRWPRLHPAGMQRIARELRAAGDALRTRPVADIIRVIDAATQRWLGDAEQMALLLEPGAALTGYSQRMMEHVVMRMANDWRAPALTALVDAELGDANGSDGTAAGPIAVDAFVARNGVRVRALGPELSVHLLAGNVPGVGITSVVRALLVKAPVLAKVASGEPLLTASFARAIHEVDASIGAAIGVTYWAGGSEAIERAAFEEADVVIHYGNRDAVEDVRRRLTSHTRLVEHGPRISFGMVGADALPNAEAAEQVAGEVAGAVAMFDQQGCVSPHVVYIESGGAVGPRQVSALVAAGLERAQKHLPAGPITPADAAAVRRVRDAAEFRAISGQEVEVWGDQGLGFTVVYDAVPAFTASCLNRTITIHPVDSLNDVIDIIRPYRDVLQSVAIATAQSRIDELATPLALAGVTRITTFNDLPWPHPTWHHDGRGPLRELLRWVDLG